MDSATVAKGSFLALSLPVILSACQRSQQALEQGAGFRVFEADEAADLTAIAARIIPTDDTPGATEAGVIYFSTLSLPRPDGPAAGLTQRRAWRAARAVNNWRAPYPRAHEAQQDQLLRDNEQTPFFATMRYLTIAGTFSLPRYGGNRDKVGYQLIGYEDRGLGLRPTDFMMQITQSEVNSCG